jgi:hypothetical protein
LLDGSLPYCDVDTIDALRFDSNYKDAAFSVGEPRHDGGNQLSVIALQFPAFVRQRLELDVQCLLLSICNYLVEVLGGF